MSPHPVTNFERQTYCQNEHKFNDVYLKNMLPKIINLDEQEPIG